MLTVTFNEMELNAVLSGLVQVIHSNSVAKGNLQQQRDSPSNREAIECCDMAIRHAMAAQLTIAASLPDPEYPAAMTVAMLDWSDSERRAAFGDR